MITTNETGPHKGRYLLRCSKRALRRAAPRPRNRRRPTRSGRAPTRASHVAFDACYWTPWGTLITAEESLGDRSPPARPVAVRTAVRAQEPDSTRAGHLPPSPPTATTAPISSIRTSIPRVSHEGIQFDKAGNMYFIDELNGGTSTSSRRRRKLGRRDVGQGATTSMPDRRSCCASATATRRTPPAATPGCRSPMRTAQALPGAITITDVSGVTSVDARNTTDLPAFKGTDYQRPEDMQIQTIDGQRYLYVDDDEHPRGLSRSICAAARSASSPTATRSTLPPARPSAAR